MKLVAGERDAQRGSPRWKNWLGYLVLAGGVFALRVIAPPADWAVGATALQALAVVLWLAAAAYLLACYVSRQREWTLRGHRVSQPPLRVALLQMLLSAANWAHHRRSAARAAGWPHRLSAVVLGILLVAALAASSRTFPPGWVCWKPSSSLCSVERCRAARCWPRCSPNGQFTT